MQAAGHHAVMIFLCVELCTNVINECSIKSQ